MMAASLVLGSIFFYYTEVGAIAVSNRSCISHL
jgi:hypothetical protein